MAAPLNTCTTIEQRGVVRFLWAKVMAAKDYYYRYSALGPVWAETRAQSVDWYSSGTLHPGQVLRGSLPFAKDIHKEMLSMYGEHCLSRQTVL